MAILAPPAIAAVKMAWMRGSPRRWSTPQSAPADQIRVAAGVRPLEIVEQAAPLTDHDQEPAPRVKVLLMRAEMIGQVADALRQDRHLNLGRAGVVIFRTIFADQRLFALGSDRHRFGSFND